MQSRCQFSLAPPPLESAAIKKNPMDFPVAKKIARVSDRPK
ncbi:hypothetical protein RISK_005644 [Rhodopirellula islandica]|uniref:Uncharacterized protein n=1 Tax=Rhodopirellula islandica TaxID=595434 RepID=A0A0J1B7N2_RHOIS|nr:hypothetical protein RISK_005644 [Rhodopirellula islandica]